MKKSLSRNTEAMWEEHALRRGDTRCDSQSYLPWVIRIETPSGLFLSFLFFFFFFVSHCGREKEGRGERTRPQVTFWIISSVPGANEWERKREGGREREGGRRGGDVLR